MKGLISIAFGAAALATVSFAAPAQASDGVGVSAVSNAAVVSVAYWGSCRDYWYRRNHPYRCGYGYYGYRRYYNGYHHRYYDNYYRHRHNNRHNRYHRAHDRW